MLVNQALRVAASALRKSKSVLGSRSLLFRFASAMRFQFCDVLAKFRRTLGNYCHVHENASHFIIEFQCLAPTRELFPREWFLSLFHFDHEHMGNTHALCECTQG